MLNEQFQFYEHLRKQPAKKQPMRMEQYLLRWQYWAKSVLGYGGMVRIYDTIRCQIALAGATRPLIP